MEDLAVQEAPKENGISEPETNDSVFESASTEAAKAAAEIKAETLAPTPTRYKIIFPLITEKVSKYLAKTYLKHF